MESNIKKLIKKLNPEELKYFITKLSEDEVTELLYDWEVWGRNSQLEPVGDWAYWLILAGRGWG